MTNKINFPPKNSENIDVEYKKDMILSSLLFLVSSHKMDAHVMFIIGPSQDSNLCEHSRISTSSLCILS